MIPAGARFFIVGFLAGILFLAPGARAFSIAEAWQGIGFPEEMTRKYYRADNCRSNIELFLACVRGLDDALRWAEPPLRLLPDGLGPDDVKAGVTVSQAQLWRIAAAAAPTVPGEPSHSAGVSGMLRERDLTELKWREVYFRMLRSPEKDLASLIDEVLAHALGEKRPLPAVWPERAAPPRARVFAQLRARFDNGLRDAHFEIVPSRWTSHLLSTAPRLTWDLPFTFASFGHRIWVETATGSEIQPGDELIELDGRAVVGLEREALDAIFEKHPEGLRFTFQSLRSSQPIAKFARPARTPSPAVQIAELPGFPRMGWIRLRGLEEGISAEIKAGMKDNADRFDAWVLDLQDNAGGLLSEAAAVASLFIVEKGPAIRIVAPNASVARFLQQLNAPLEIEFPLTGDSQAFGSPLLVLVNRQTGSAAEALAAVLQDKGRALVAGSLTFGKGVALLVGGFSGDLDYRKTTQKIEIGAQRRGYHGAGLRPNLEFALEELAVGERDAFPATVVPFETVPLHSEPSALRDWKAQCASSISEGGREALFASAGKLLECHLRAR